MAFYQGLYETLLTEFKKLGQTDDIIYLGGSDVVDILLGLLRDSLRMIEVNIYYGTSESDPLNPLEFYLVKMQLEGTEKKIMVNSESSYSLFALIGARKKRHAEGDPNALSDVEQNIFLKWNLVVLTPKGIEIYPLDSQSKRDLETRTLRLDLDRGTLNDYALHYNLIVAYRALRAAGRAWHLDDASKVLIAESIQKLNEKDLLEAVNGAAGARDIREGKGGQEGMWNLIQFVREKIDEEADNQNSESLSQP